MLRKRHFLYNPFFLIPFLAWVITGGILLLNYSAKDLFFYINQNHNPAADTVMYYTTWMGEGYFIIGVLLFLMALPWFRNWWYFFTALFCNIIPFFILQMIKSYYDAPRPINYFNHAAWIHLSKGWPELLYRGYPSGHSEGAFCFFCFLRKSKMRKEK